MKNYFVCWKILMKISACSGTDLGEVDSGDDDANPEWKFPIMQTYTRIQRVMHGVIGHLQVKHIPFTVSKGLNVHPHGNEPIDYYFNLLFDERLLSC